MRLVWSTMCICVGALMVAGCGAKLNDKRDLSLEVGKIETLTVEPIKSDQDVNVKVESKGKLSIHCYLEKDKEVAEKAINANKASDTILAKEENVESANLKCSVPANQKLIVRLSTNKKAEVKVTMTN